MDMWDMAADILGKKGLIAVAILFVIGLIVMALVPIELMFDIF